MATPTPRRPRPYRDFLTPALHRQFTRAAGLAIAVCYAEAVYLGATDSTQYGTDEDNFILMFDNSFLVMVSHRSYWRTHIDASNKRTACHDHTDIETTWYVFTYMTTRARAKTQKLDEEPQPRHSRHSNHNSQHQAHMSHLHGTRHQLFSLQRSTYGRVQ